MLKNIILIVVSLIGVFGCASKEELALAQRAESIPTLCVQGNSGTGQPNGCYLMNGGLSLKVAAPNILNVTASAPHMELFQVKAVFLAPSGAADNFVLILPPLSSGASATELRGVWQMSNKPKSKAFSVDVTSLTDLQDSGFNIKITKQVFTGTVLSSGNISGSISLAASIPKLASLSITSSAYTGKPVTPETAAAAKKRLANQVYLNQAIAFLPEPLQQFIQDLSENGGGQ